MRSAGPLTQQSTPPIDSALPLKWKRAIFAIGVVVAVGVVVDVITVLRHSSTANAAGADSSRAIADTTVIISSDPAWAEVYRNGEMIGTTPFPVPRPSGTDAVSYELRHADCEPKKIAVTKMSDAVFRVSLARSAAAAPAKTP